MAKKKIALCISGYLRTFEECYPSIYKNIIEDNDVDIFIHTYDKNGKIIVDANGIPVPTDFAHIIGNVNPNWTGGITNTLTYKNWAFSFLIDVQEGGQVYGSSVSVDVTIQSS